MSHLWWPKVTQEDIDAIRRAQRFDEIAKDKAQRQRLRDQFAAAALTGLLASDQYDRLVTAADYADAAYEMADAMLAAREVK